MKKRRKIARLKRRRNVRLLQLLLLLCALNLRRKLNSGHLKVLRLLS
jgi:hypothetical protein